MARRVRGASGNTVQSRVVPETPGHALKGSRRIAAVVVRERDDGSSHLRQGFIACPREAAAGTKAADCEIGMPLQNGVEALVVVLIGNQHLEVPVVL